LIDRARSRAGLAQVLMASTYPLEIVHAARWVKENPKLKGEAAVKAVENQPWDTSVKSMVEFPQILGPMNDKLDWTQRLGDAFLAQQKTSSLPCRGCGHARRNRAT
jgi:hypothetical protein